MLRTPSFLRSGAGRARLPFPKGLPQRIFRAYQAVCRVPREDLTPAGQYLEDHALFLLEEADRLRREARRGAPLPRRAGVPRLMEAARRVCQEEELSAAAAVRVVRAAFGEEEAAQEELSLLSTALGCALMEALEGAVYALERDLEAREKALEWADAFAHRKVLSLPGEETLRAWVLYHLSQREETEALREALEQLKAAGEKEQDVSRRFQERQAEAGRRMGRLIGDLRRLGRLPMDAVFERLSPVARALRMDASFCRMDRESRDYYCQCACRAARRFGISQKDAALCAVALAQGKEGAEGEAGYYLIERPDLIAVQAGKRKKPSWALRRRTGLFLLPLYGGAALVLALCWLFHAPKFTWPLIVLCASQWLRRGEYALIRRFFPARTTPRLQIKRLGEERRTLVAVPCLLTSRKQAMAMLRHLSVLRLANPDAHLDFMLLADFPDAREERREEDEEILLAARLSLEALNDRYGGGFLYLHRARTWDAAQGRYTGRERKRGALEALNHLLTEGKCADSFLYMSHSGEALKGRYAYVITLDSDTFLPAGAALKLVGAMEHPLQKGRVGVIQPRMEVGADTVRTRIQKALGGRGGTDPYHTAAQDVYQDVFGRGSFVGKGIYAPDKWLEATAGRLPAGRLLSHDLIEGETVVSALADDIALYDGHPARLSGWQKRLHRWTRGDWQLLPFLMDRRLSLLSRHKIWDNLLRSLVPGAQALLLLCGAALKSPALCLLALPWPLRGMGMRLALLPGRACTLLDAAARAVYRLFISRKNLLSWVTAAQAEQGADIPLPCVLAQLGAGAALTALSLLPGGVWPAALAGLSWLVSPLLVSYWDGPADAPRPLTPGMEADARRLARDTWGFFEDAVTEQTLFLPPDNVQEDPKKGTALRTSPTNIGLYLLSCCAAREMKFISAAEMGERISRALDTLETLQTWKGHFYNWYDLSAGEALEPRFVSTVDSGNCAACLLCCAQLLRAQLSQLPKERLDLPRRLDALAGRMDFSALYDRKEKLFWIGWETEEGRPTAAHYDTLASEARLTSFLAIMTGQVERKHWFAMNRAVVRAGGGTALLSWGGTMFEYLMPALLLPLTPGTLLGESCLNAVKAQMAADPARPFGVSESGYYAFDPEMNYQYRAFGLPALAKSPETRGQVISPYASILAMPFFPRAAADNMRRMEKLGWRDAHGFYEAADGAPQRVESGVRVVKSHMAHHQGMILCALCNALEKNALSRAFMALPAARANADLLLERAPASAPRRVDLPPPRTEKGPGKGGLHPARGGMPPECQALFGAGTAWTLTPNGQGYLKAGSVMLTRFDAQAGAQTGPQFYVRDRESGDFIRPAVAGGAAFGDGAARYTLVWRRMKITLRCCVHPLTGVAVAMLEMENPGGEEREMECVSFLEVAQGTQAADEAHPNFRDLSVRILPWGSRGLLSRRLPREEGDETPLICHGAAGDVLALRRQGDRGLFLGRLGDYAAPEQMRLPMEEAPCRAGDVTAPCLSLRVRARVPAEGSARVYFFTSSGNAPQNADAALTPSRALESFSLSAAQNRMLLGMWGMDGAMESLYRQMLGALLFYDQPHQALFPAAPPQALWRFGISGALPLLLVSCLDGADAALIRHALRCHGYLRAMGAQVDLAFFCPEERAYARPVLDRVTQLVSLSPERNLRGVPGGVFLCQGDETQEKEMESLSRLTLKSGQPLRRQLAALRLEEKEGEAVRPALPEPLPPLRLEEDNSFGGFLPQGGYCVKGPAPVPWHHILCGPSFGTLVCETGILYSYAFNSRLGRLTRPSPDVKRGVPSEEIYLRDETGAVYSLTRGAAYYEPGAAVYRALAGEVTAEVAVFAHESKAMGVRSVTLRCEKEKTLSLYWLARFSLGEGANGARCRAEGEFVFAQNGNAPYLGWAAMEGASCQALSAQACFGCKGEKLPPALAGPVRGVGSVGFLSRQVTVGRRESRRVIMALGAAAGEKSAREDFAFLLSQGAAQAEHDARGVWSRRLSGVQIFHVEESLERMMNLWLPYQVWASRLLARMGPYQAGGAVGFRDQLQDCLALLYTDGDFVRAHLLLCAAHQFQEGDVQHWWHPPRRGVRTRVSDDKLFLPFLTALYVQATGDERVLYQEAPYLVSAPLAEEEKERYEEPEVSAFQETLLSHCARAIDSVALGGHGLPLMRGGDWNDGMNRVGGEKGESVWLGFFLAWVLREFAPFCPSDKKEKYHALRRSLLDSAESAWTGAWYLRAWTDKGEALGGPDTAPPRIDLISQCFAALAGAPREHARLALIHAVDLLYDRDAGMVRLLDPPFAPEENAGYIGAYLPGVRENGGQYTHAVPWLIMALCRMGEYALAWEIALAALPSRHAETREQAIVYQIEPYVLAGDVYAKENRGRGGWSWYTGSAAWLYWVVLTELLGFERRGDKARLQPRCAPDAEEFTITYRFGTANYHFTAARDTIFPTLDGARLEDGWAALSSDGRTHEARFPMRSLG